MNKRRLFSVGILLLIMLMISGCQNQSGSNAEGGVVEFEFWAAPNPDQESFWVQKAEEYMEENSDVKINVSQMSENPTSEASIQTALAGGSAPAISENISRGFAAELAKSSAIMPLNEFEGFEELVSEREMTETMSTWKFFDDNQYVLPEYSNAMLMAWRIDILKEIGFEEPPKTFGEMMELGDRLKEEYPDKHLWVRDSFVKPTWNDRWFDFFMIYNSASNGNNFIEGSDFVADDVAGVETLSLLGELSEKNLLLAREAQNPFERGESVLRDLGPWSFTGWEENYPEMKLDETFTLSMPPVLDDGNPEEAKTFADTKGLSIYAQVNEEQQQAAFDFIKWVYSNPDNDLEWFERTNLPPARDDLATNEVFTGFLEENPELQMYAENIPNAVPPIDTDNFVEIQELIGTEGLNPVVRQEKDPETAWQDVVDRINDVLQ